jgi:hypothetical protein
VTGHSAAEGGAALPAPWWELLLVVVAMTALVLAAFWLMRQGWLRRGRKHELPAPLPVPADPAEPLLRARATYFGTTTAWSWLDRVVAHGLGTPSPAELRLRTGGLDVLRPADSFHVPAGALRGARLDQGIAGKVVPPRGILVITWEHGDQMLDSGFRLSDSSRHQTWVTAIDTSTKERQA